MLKKKRKKKSKFYFNVDVEDAIVKYNSESNQIIRNKIYNARIKYALEKLVENIINTYKFPYIPEKFTDVKNEVISHLIINLHKYNKSLGFKAYSYFGTSAKNYLIMKNRSDYLKTKINFSIDDTESNVDGNKKEFELEDHHIITNNIRVDRSCFIEIFSDYIDKNINIIFKKSRDIKIANAIIQLLQNYDVIENYTKKNIYVILKEMTNCKAIYITKVLDKIKVVYFKLKEEYNHMGELK